MSMKELISKFLILLRYVPYIIDEKPKIQIFLSCLPTCFKDRIEFDNPKTLEEAMRKADFCYEQSNKREILPNWKNKKTSHFDQKRRGFKSNKSFGNNSQKFSNNNYQRAYFKNKVPQNNRTPNGRDMLNKFVKNNELKEPVKCWEFQGLQYTKYCLNIKGNFSNVHMIQEQERVGDVEN